MQRVVVVTVIAALEFQHQLAPGKSARESERVKRCLGAIPNELHRLGARNQLRDTIRKAKRYVIYGIEARSARNLFLNRRDYTRMSVTDHHRSGAKHEVDQRPPVGRDDATSFAATDDERNLVGQLERAEAVARNGTAAHGARGYDHCVAATARPLTTQHPSARSGSCSIKTP